MESYIYLFIFLATILLLAGMYRYKTRASKNVSPEPSGAIASNPMAIALKNLSFRDALNFERAARIVEESLNNEIKAIISNGAADALNIGTQTIDIVQTHGTFLAKFPEAAQKLKNAGKADFLMNRSGETLAQLRDVSKKGKPFLDHARKLDPSLMHNLAKIGPILTSGAHLIAGMDNARKLKQIDRKIDIIISSRYADMLGELEAIYGSMREAILSQTTSDRAHLLSLQFKLRRLRCQWINQAEAALNRIDNPDDRSLVSKIFSIDANTAKAIENQLSAQEEPLYLTRFALLLEQMIAITLHKTETFEQLTLPEAKQQVGTIKALVTERKDWIEKLSTQDNRSAQNIAGACDAFDESLGNKKIA